LRKLNSLAAENEFKGKIQFLSVGIEEDSKSIFSYVEKEKAMFSNFNLNLICEDDSAVQLTFIPHLTIIDKNGIVQANGSSSGDLKQALLKLL
jgi:hypothetical protein